MHPLSQQQMRETFEAVIRRLEADIEKLSNRPNTSPEYIIAWKRREIADMQRRIERLDNFTAEDSSESISGYMRPCETCNGTGGTNRGDDVRICPDCNGTGIYTDEDSTHE